MASTALEEKINKIKQQNEEIKRRYQEVEEDKKHAAKLNALVQMVPSDDWPERIEPPEFSNPVKTYHKQRAPAARDPPHQHQQYHSNNEGKKVHKFAQGEGPPPDPKYNFLADNEREDSFNENRRANPTNKMQTRTPQNHFKKKSFGRDDYRKDGKMYYESNRDDDHPEYDAWRAERNRIDEDRISRQKTAEGNWRREWDNDKVYMASDLNKKGIRNPSNFKNDYKQHENKYYSSSNDYSNGNRSSNSHRPNRGYNKSTHGDFDHRYSNQYDHRGRNLPPSRKSLSNNSDERMVVASDESIKITLNQSNSPKAPVMSVKVNSPNIAGTGRVGPRQRSRITYSSQSDADIKSHDIPSLPRQKSFDDKHKGISHDKMSKAYSYKKPLIQKKKESTPKLPYSPRNEFKKNEVAEYSTKSAIVHEDSEMTLGVKEEEQLSAVDYVSKNDDCRKQANTCEVAIDNDCQVFKSLPATDNIEISKDNDAPRLDSKDEDVSHWEQKVIYNEKNSCSEKVVTFKAPQDDKEKPKVEDFASTNIVDKEMEVLTPTSLDEKKIDAATPAIVKEDKIETFTSTIEKEDILEVSSPATVEKEKIEMVTPVIINEDKIEILSSAVKKEENMEVTPSAILKDKTMEADAPIIIKEEKTEIVTAAVANENEIKDLTLTIENEEEIETASPAITKEEKVEALIPTILKEEKLEEITPEFLKENKIKVAIPAIEREKEIEVVSPVIVKEKNLEAATSLIIQEKDIEVLAPTFHNDENIEVFSSAIVNEEKKDDVISTTVKEEKVVAVTPVFVKKDKIEVVTPSIVKENKIEILDLKNEEEEKIVFVTSKIVKDEKVEVNASTNIKEDKLQAFVPTNIDEDSPNAKENKENQSESLIEDNDLAKNNLLESSLANIGCKNNDKISSDGICDSKINQDIAIEMECNVVTDNDTDENSTVIEDKSLGNASAKEGSEKAKQESQEIETSKSEVSMLTENAIETGESKQEAKSDYNNQESITTATAFNGQTEIKELNE
ncbi:enolase-phosphatase E1-like [Prorops nasuta]|uniref:enolase-phosphatase E1-like n=1 Tax=Prorops nasuta TaxID=863751 RepID=UPI0034CE92D6